MARVKVFYDEDGTQVAVCRTVAEFAAADNQLHATPGARFTVREEEREEPFFEVTRNVELPTVTTATGAALLAENEADAELAEFVRTAAVGEVLQLGGGAAPRVDVARIA